MQPTRRQALAAGAAVLVAGCTTSAPTRPRRRTTDDALREAAAAREQELIAACAAAARANPGRAVELQGLLTDHTAHLARLGPVAVPTATPTPTGPSTLRALAARERAVATAHAGAALTASRELAALLASLAACEASHAALL